MYFIIKDLHIIFTGVWLAAFIAGLIFRGKFSSFSGKIEEKKSILNWIGVTSPLSNIGAIGVLLTGLYLSIVQPMYGFFQFAAKNGNHWLYTKQFIFVLILILVFAVLIPATKKARNLVNQSLNEESTYPDGTTKAVKKMMNVDMAINIMVILNILLAFSRHLI